MPRPGRGGAVIPDANCQRAAGALVPGDRRVVRERRAPGAGAVARSRCRRRRRTARAATAAGGFGAGAAPPWWTLARGWRRASRRVRGATTSGPAFETARAGGPESRHGPGGGAAAGHRPGAGREDRGISRFRRSLRVAGVPVPGAWRGAGPCGTRPFDGGVFRRVRGGGMRRWRGRGPLAAWAPGAAKHAPVVTSKSHVTNQGEPR